MQRLRESLAHGGVAMLAVVFALAFAAFSVAQSLAQVVVFVLQQHAGSEDFDPLDFEILGTRLSLDGLVQSALTLLLLATALVVVWRLVRPTVRTCPECRSPVPLSATICRYCTTDLEESA